MPRSLPHLLAVFVVACSGIVRAATPLDYDKDVKPVLAARCFQCHGPEKQKAGLRLDVKESVLRGGESGEPAIVPGNALKSHLLKLVTSNDPGEFMPPKGDRLTIADVELIKKWVEEGAHWVTKEGDKNAPKIELVAVEEAPLSEADREWWSFRKPIAHEPPTTRSRWGETKIDRFILARLEEAGIAPSAPASPRTFVRRVTFDLTGLPPAPEDVESFARDKSPMAKARLVERLLASPAFGERMASLWLPLARYAEDQAHQVGSDTKFFYPNAWRYREWVINAFNRDMPYDRFIKLQLAADKIDASADDLVALGFVGLGPKYYSRNRLDVMAEEWEDRVDTVTRTTLALTVACARCHDHKFDPIRTRDYYALAGIFASTKMVNRTSGGVEVKSDTKADQMDPTTLHIVEDADVKDLNIFIRGNVERKGPTVPRRFIRVLCEAEPKTFTQGSGRKELAEAIASRENPLTARVMVNRVWGMLMGKPLVGTPSNFGHSGELPTHPELLDDLAVRFMENDWSIKWLVREIALSAAYGQSSQTSARGVADPSNVLMWRMNRRRLSVEQWRDMVLLASGRLAGGGGKSLELDDANNFRRTVYARISRLKLNDLLMQFDYPDANVHAEKRSVTTTPAQKLFMLNSPFVIGAARSIVARLRAEGIEEDAAKIERLYGLVLGRNPRAEEVELAEDFLKAPQESGMSRLEQFAQVMLVCSEAIYVD